MDDVSESDIEYARLQIEEADRRLETVIERASKIDEVAVPASTMDDVSPAVEDEVYEVSTTVPDQDAIQNHVQNIIMDCQFCIEISVKSMFKLVGKEYPFQHGVSLSDGRTQGFYHEVPDSFEKKSEIIRAVFLTQFWNEFYELAKYGVPQMNVRPEVIFSGDDGERAIDDSIFCVDLAKDLLGFVKEYRDSD
jgi:HEPN domain-containing protein